MKACTTSLLARGLLRPHSSSSLLAAASPQSPRVSGLISTRSSLARQHGRIGFSRSFITDEKASGASKKKALPFAFAFDIDGVLLHVAKPIPGASETLTYLQQHNIPFILLTNGGGKHEAERVADLSARLGVSLSTDNFVQSHTPFQELARLGGGSFGSVDAADAQSQEENHNGSLRHKNILVTGSDPAKSRLIAEQYGFRSVITPADILAAHPSIFPFEPLLTERYAATARPLPTPNPKIDAIFVFNDPRDWALDSQLILDLLLSEGGVLGTYSAKNGRKDLEGHGWQSDGQPRLFFSNPDLFWSASYDLPRFGQGAFQGALAGVWAEITGGKASLKSTTIGKPYALTYAYAERVLGAHRAALLKSGGGDNTKKETVEAELQHEMQEAEGGEKAATGGLDGNPLERVYMVGDNPESDIRGANEYRSPAGTDWTSVLVRTGVWSAERGEPKHTPRVVVDDVKAAVGWALEREGWR
ncbi:Uu.00g116940.m01.CDS01 [Anthostomella pinea]|uniref:Uu.00g116940.m01.CDS01 n=1 Tax=Anthostomella pinea TaxID=933095 RepID=A0AAI8VH29_9PEZI|nr:Uu.00g116940.m01.CDS01 [Anthostomella pinea]